MTKDYLIDRLIETSKEAGCEIGRLLKRIEIIEKQNRELKADLEIANEKLKLLSEMVN